MPVFQIKKCVSSVTQVNPIKVYKDAEQFGRYADSWGLSNTNRPERVRRKTDSDEGFNPKDNF